MSRLIALTGPAAAAMWKLDGFRDLAWPPLWCSPINGASSFDVVRTRLWEDPVEIDGISVAPISTVLRHLGSVGSRVLPGSHDSLGPHDLAELALEHALRLKYVDLATLLPHGGSQPGDVLLREVVARRPRGEPATESYAETRLIQRLRSIGIDAPWRQVKVIGATSSHRADCMVSYRLRRRPAVIRASMGFLVELDSREFHQNRFEEDHARELTYNDLGYRWLIFTPRQIETDWPRVARTILRTRDDTTWPSRSRNSTNHRVA
jgi:hypothetical protein